MTEEQYWEGRPDLVIDYREAEKIRKERVNEEMWLQGVYVYDAILRTTPVLHAFAKKSARPVPYLEKPYPINQKSQEKRREEEEKAKSDKGLKYMESLMGKYNKKFKEKEEDKSNA